MPGIFQPSLSFQRIPRTAPSEARIEKLSQIATLTGQPGVFILTLWNLGNRYASDSSFPQDQRAGLQEPSTSSPGRSRNLRGVHWPHTGPTGCLTCGRRTCPSGLRRRFWAPSSLPPSSPHTNAGTSLSGPGEAVGRSAVTRKWSRHRPRVHTEAAPASGPSSRLSVNHQPARGPVRRTAPAPGPGCPFPWPPRLVPATSSPTSSGARPEPSCPSGRTAAPSSPRSWTQIWTRTRPAASQLCSLGPGTDLGLAKPVPAPSQVPPRPQEQVSLVKVKKKKNKLLRVKSSGVEPALKVKSCFPWRVLWRAAKRFSTDVPDPRPLEVNQGTSLFGALIIPKKGHHPKSWSNIIPNCLLS